jgi:hypothetical protein
LISAGFITSFSARPLMENDWPVTTGFGAIDPIAVIPGHEPTGEAQLTPKSAVSAPATPLVPITPAVAPSAVIPANAVATVASATTVRTDFFRLLATSASPCMNCAGQTSLRQPSLETASYRTQRLDT